MTKTRKIYPRQIVRRRVGTLKNPKGKACGPKLKE